MKPTRVLPLLVLLPLLPAMWAVLATEAAPRSGGPPTPAPLVVPAAGEFPKPLPGLTRRGIDLAGTTGGARALPVVAGSPRSRWPADWPSLDAFPAGGASASMQMMGSGDMDVDLPASSEAPPDEEDGEAEKKAPPTIVDEFDEQPEIAEGRRLREEALQRRERDEAAAERRSLEEFNLTDEERVRRRTQKEEGRKLIADVDAEIDRRGDPFGELPPAASPPEAGNDEAEPEVERPTTQPTVEAPPPVPALGFRFTSPEGQPVERFLVGQSFHVELRVTPEEASIPGRLGGTRELEFIEATLISEEGKEQTIRLWRVDEPSEDGLIRFVGREPISIAARVNGNPLPGTIEDLDLDLRGPEDTLIEPIEIRSRREVGNGATVILLYGKPITAALAEVKEAINTVEEYLRAERTFVEGLMEDAAGDEEVLAELRAWLERIDDQLSVAAQARHLAENEYNDEYKLVLSSRLLQTLIQEGPNGWEISERNPLRTGSGNVRHVNDILFYERKELDEKYKGRAMVQRAAFDVITPYLMTSYSQFAHITMGAPAFTLVSGLDEFGKEGSRGWAAVELVVGVGLTVVAVKLPSSIHSYIDEGRLIPSKKLDFRSSPAGEPLARRPGRAGAQPPSVRERGFIPGEKPGVGAGATPQARVGRAETEVRTDPAANAVAPDGRVLGRAGIETRGGELPYPGRGPARRGIDPETRRYWQEKTADDPMTGEPVAPTDPVTGEIHTPQVINRHLASMDDAVGTARQRGVPDEVIEQALLESRSRSNVQEAAEFVGTRLELEVTTRERGRIFTTTADKTELQFEGFATPQQLENVTVIDIPTLEVVITKSHLEAGGKPQTWTVEEIRYGRSITRRLEAGEDVSQWKTVDFSEGSGLRPLFGAEDLGAIRSTFTSRPLRIATETPPPSRAPAAAPGVAPAAEAAPSRGAPAPRTVEPGAQTETVGRRTQRVDPPERPADADPMTPGERAAAVERTTPRERPAPPPAEDGDVFGPRPTRGEGVTREPAEFIDDDPGGFLRSFYGDESPAAAAFEIATRELGAENVYGIAGSYAKGNARVRSWPDDIGYRDAKLLDKLPEDIPAGILERLPPKTQELHGRLRKMGGGDGLPSDMDVAVSEALDIGALEAAAAKAFEETGVLIEFVSGSRPAPVAPPRPAALPETTPRTASVVNPAAEPTALGGPSGRGPSTGVEVMIRSLGGSTGRVVEAFFVNHDDEPVRIQASGVALEPVELDEKARVRAEEILDAASAGKALPPPEPDDDRTVFTRVRTGAGPMPLPASWRGASVVRVVLDGYCLELAAGVPTQGTFFRIADRETQDANGGLRAILESSRKLRDRGELHPDGDPEAYFHSVRQWAIWVDENRFDREAFEVAFIEHVQKNFEAAGRAWSAEAEELLREFIPNRWNDVVAVLESAGLDVPASAAVPVGVVEGRSSR